MTETGPFGGQLAVLQEFVCLACGDVHHADTMATLGERRECSLRGCDSGLSVVVTAVKDGCSYHHGWTSNVGRVRRL